MIKANNKSVSQIYAGDKNCFIASKGNNVIFENDCNAFDITLKDGKTIDDLYRCVYIPIEESPYRWRKDKWFFQKLSGNNIYRIFSPPGTSLNAVLMFVDCIKALSVYKISNNIQNIEGFDPNDFLAGICIMSGIESFDISSIPLRDDTSLNSLLSDCESLISANIDANGAVIRDLNSLFYFCKNLESFSFRGFSNSENVITDLMFSCCYKIKEIDITCFKSLLKVTSAFSDCKSLVTLKLPTVNDIRGFDTTGCLQLKNISATLKDVGYDSTFKLSDSPLTRESAMIFIDYATRNPSPRPTSYANIQFSTTTQKYLTADDIKKATDANWNVSFLDPKPFIESNLDELRDLYKNAEVK